MALQWVCCYEGYAFLKSTLVKELSFVCLQTWQYQTFHIIPDTNAKITHQYHDEARRRVFDLQLQKHNIPWVSGTVCEEELINALSFSSHSTIYVVDPALAQYLEDVLNMCCVEVLSIPWNRRKIPQCPNHTCGEYGHMAGFTYCAQRRCFEVASYFKPLMVDYLMPELLQKAANDALYLPPKFKTAIPLEVDESINSSVDENIKSFLQ
jgi:hypothetical protein